MIDHLADIYDVMSFCRRVCHQYLGFTLYYICFIRYLQKIIVGVSRNVVLPLVIKLEYRAQQYRKIRRKIEYAQLSKLSIDHVSSLII